MELAHTLTMMPDSPLQVLSFMPNFPSDLNLPGFPSNILLPDTSDEELNKMHEELKKMHKELEKIKLPMMAITPELVYQFFHHVQEFNETFNSLCAHLDYFQYFVETKINVIYVEKHDEV